MGEGFLSKVKNLVGIEEVEEDEILEDEPVKETPKREAPKKEERPAYEPKTFTPRKETREEPSSADRGTGAVNRLTKQLNMIVIEPKSFDECPRLVDSLKGKKPVIINLEKVESETARKIFDFLSGATYALSGNVQKVSANIFLFAPENVDITAPAEGRTAFQETIKSPWR
jgi:cell division inhibitor SepF